MRVFDSGATRDSDDSKIDYEGFLSPLVLERFGDFMHAHRLQSDGELRDSDNWQKGIPIYAYMKGLLRHVFAVWKMHRGYAAYDEKGIRVNIQDELCAVIFNAQGMLYELIQEELDMVPVKAPEAVLFTPGTYHGGKSLPCD